jgi:D-alanyl-D-alanine dipeptidase
MTLDEKLQRSQSTERIDFSQYQSINQDDSLVRLNTEGKVLVEPCWTLENDWEGSRYRDYIATHPEVSDEEALDHAREFVSDPDITLPPHVCGAAVDVDVLETDNESSYLYYPGLTEVQKAHRLMLVRAMLDAGLASCMTEWWHFSYGDQLWAWFYGKHESIYSPVDL